MRKFRYRTRVLIGPWRDTPEQAMEDAVRARQAQPSDGGPQWVVPGSIEEQAGRKRPAGREA
ncbi:MAG: hypothetical protein ACK4K7_13770 [Allosphingosinicella sp.]|uniref:hypothetical protein n=1 Tax=Allosphingosinicella sp. TaxID=2823234 RepID=UPI003958C575